MMAARHAAAGRIGLTAVAAGVAPIFVGMSATMLTSLTDTLVASYFGAAAIAGVGIANFFFFLLFAFANGLANAVQSYTGRALGRGDEADTRDRALVHGVIFALMASIVLAGLALLWVRPVAMLVSDDPEVVSAVLGYIVPLIIALPLYFWNAVCRGYFTAIGRAWYFARVNLVIQAVNIVLSLILGLGLLGLPALGVLGIGVATAIAYAVGALMNAFAIVAVMPLTRLRGFRPRRDFTVPFLRHAAQSGSGQAIYAAGWIISFWIVGQLGTESLAVYQLIAQATLFPIYLSNACGSFGIATISRQRESDPSLARESGWRIVHIGTVTIAIYALLLALIAETMLLFYLDDPGVASQFRTVVQIAAIALPAYTYAAILGQVLQGAHDYAFVLRVSAGTQWLLFLPLAYALGPGLGLALTGVMLAELAYRTTMMAIYIRRWRFVHLATEENPDA
jgi:MATE family multidrug resistance protein